VEAAPPWVLLADDDEDDAALAHRALRRVAPEVRVERASNGIETLACLQSCAVPPALVLLDLKMPLVDGFTVLERLGPVSYPILVLSSSDIPKDRARAEALGCAEFLTKPIDYNEYLTLVGGVLLRHLKR
jgi:CheY-like chemotaxis protein